MKMNENKPQTLFNDNMNPEVLHGRAREASLELRKLIITLATAILGFSFILITADQSKINNISKYFLFMSLVTMSLTVLFGLLQIYADGKRNYYRAKWLQVKDDIVVKREMYNFYDKWKFRLSTVKIISRVTFTLGLIFLVIALYDRII